MIPKKKSTWAPPSFLASEEYLSALVIMKLDLVANGALNSLGLRRAVEEEMMS